MGTVPYMSPEQALGKPADPRSDIFSIGVMLYQLVTARLPFGGTTQAETLLRIVSAQPEPMARFNYELPLELERIIRKCLEKEPERRYQTVSELLVDLRNLDRDRQTPVRGMSRRRAAMLALLLVIMVAASVVVWRRSALPPSPVRSIAVLPFEGDLGEGIAEMVISDLTRLRELRVMARSTSFRHSSAESPVSAGRALEVDAVLTGTVDTSGDRIIVSTELVDVRDGSRIGGVRGELARDDITTLASLIGNDVAQALQLDPRTLRKLPVKAEAHRLRAAPLASPVASAMRISRVTASGKVIAAAISRDGAFVAYVISDLGGQSLWAKQMVSGQSLQLISPRQAFYWGLSFGPEGSLYFVEKSSAAPTGTMLQISPLGGTARPIVSGADAPPAFSPDGKRMAFLRSDSPVVGKSALLVANANGTGARVLAIVAAPELFAPVFFAGASWSPDGKSIATAIANPESGKSRLVAIDVATGTISTIADPGWRAVMQTAWLPDGSGLVAIATVEQEDRSQVWRVPVPTGEPFRVTNDLFDYRSVSLTSDGESLLTVAGDRMSDVWVVPAGEAPRRLTSGKGEHGLAPLSDGRIILPSLEGGNPDLWIMNGDGGNPARLTHDGQRNRAPAVTPDERHVVYLANTGKNVELCRMNLDGSNKRVLSTLATLSVAPAISPHGKWVVFQGIDVDSPKHKGMAVLMRISIDGGPAVPLTDFPAAAPAFSPDGSEIAFYFADVDAEDPTVGVIPARGGKPTRLLHAAPPLASSQIAWTPDGQALVVNTMPSDRANLWRLPLDGSTPTRLTNFDENLILSFAPLRGRNGWVIGRGEFTRDAVLIRDFR